MITPAEQRYLYWLTREAYGGGGAVVEVGPWLGLSTQYLAAGLRDSGVAAAPLRTYDTFVWKWGKDAHSGIDLPDDADFKPYFDRNLAPFGDAVVGIKADTAKVTWDGGPIEILFIDGPKDGPSAARTLATFAGALQPELSLIVFQDMLHAPSYGLPMLAAELERELELVHVVDAGSCVAYRLRAPLDAARLRAQPDDRTRPLREGERLWSRTYEQIRPALSRAYVGPGLAMYLYDRGRRAEAVARLRACATPPEVVAQWQRWLHGEFYFRYRGLFHERGLRRPLLDDATYLARRLARGARHPTTFAARVWRRLVRAVRR